MPSISMRPAVGSSTPRIILIVVVLPAPFGPRRPTISLRPTSNEILSTATVEPYVFESSETCRTLAAGWEPIITQEQDSSGDQVFAVSPSPFTNRLMHHATSSCHLDRRRSRGAQRASQPAAEILSVAKELDPGSVSATMRIRGIFPMLYVLAAVF